MTKWKNSVTRIAATGGANKRKRHLIYRRVRAAKNAKKMINYRRRGLADTSLYASQLINGGPLAAGIGV